MDSNSIFVTVVLLGVAFMLLMAVACGEESVAPAPVETEVSVSTATTFPQPASTPTLIPEPRSMPLAPPTPTLEERRVQTPTDFGYNTRVVDRDIHVWHAPHCPPVPPATFVA